MGVVCWLGCMSYVKISLLFIRQNVIRYGTSRDRQAWCKPASQQASKPASQHRLNRTKSRKY